VVEYATAQVSDAEMATAAEKYSYNTPDTKEAYYFRRVFEGYFPGEAPAQTVLRWVPRWQSNTDPSGRVADHHEKHVDKIRKGMPATA
jgi:asparagine synthase (glutamine-hydrolysing)